MIRRGKMSKRSLKTNWTTDSERKREQRRRREEVERAKAETLLRLSHDKEGSEGQINKLGNFRGFNLCG